MSELLNDSPTAIKIRDHILDVLQPGEKILYVTEAEVTEPDGRNVKDWVFRHGAVVVTSVRLLVAESKALGRAVILGPSWREVEKAGRYQDGKVVVQKKAGRRRLMEISIWEGTSYKTPLDRTRLDMLSMAIQEARLEVEAQVAAEQAVHDAAVTEEYEELKRRRGF